MKPFSLADSNDVSEEPTQRKNQPKDRASTHNTESVYFTNVGTQLMRPHSFTVFMAEKGKNLLFLCSPCTVCRCNSTHS
jgi:hypothetical protein